jgi:hypothetical protein
VTRKQDQIDAEALLDGFYVLRTPVHAGELDAAAVVTAYKNLKYVETSSVVAVRLVAGQAGDLLYGHAEGETKV